MESRSVRWALLFGGWTIAGIVQALFRTALARSPGDALLDLLRFDLPLAWTWAVLTPAIGWMTRAIERRTSSTAGSMLGHLPVLLAAIALHTVVRRALVVAAGQALVVPFHLTVLYYADLTILSYIAAVWAARAMHAHPLLVRRERQTQVLQRQLAGAQLAFLELQLRPHFLFNTLGAIAELAHQAPASATRMLHNVQALLRSAVAGRAHGLVSLRDELAMLEPYLDIQRLRFEDWLVLEMDVDPDAADIAIPAFTLQPLVENAVHHGLTRRSERGRILIRARRVGCRLHLDVIDNGVGLTEGAWQERGGIGLSNLRARLDALYSGEASLVLGADPSGGVAVRLDVPHRRADDDSVSRPSVAPAEATDLEDGGSPHAPGAERDEHPLLGWARRAPVLAALSGWTVVALLRIQHSFVYLVVRQRYTAEEFRAAIRFDAAIAVLWLAATPFVLWAIRLVPVVRDRVVSRLAFHAALAFGLALALTAASRVLAGDSRFPLVSAAANQVYIWNVSVYAIVLLFAHLHELRGWLRERGLAAERLRSALQEARLRHAMVELRPAVLLDAFEGVAGHIGRDTRQADESLEIIADFLRVVLDLARERLIPLRAELAAVEAYAKVLAIGTAPALRLQASVPLRLMDAPVPNGVLRAAVDAVLGDAPRGVTEVYLDVVGDGLALEIEAGARADHASAQHGASSRRLDEYEEQGLLAVLARDADGVRLRMSA